MVQTISLAEALGLAIQHHQAGRFDAAAALYRGVLQVRPDHEVALLHLGMLAYRAGRDALVVALTRHAVALNPAQVEAHVVLGVALHRLGRLEEAATAYRNALVLEPRHPRATQNLRGTLFQSGRRTEALAAERDEALARFRAALGPLAPAGSLTVPLDEAAPAFPEGMAQLRLPVFAGPQHAEALWARVGAAESARTSFRYPVPSSRLTTLEGGYAAGRFGALFDCKRRLVGEVFPDEFWLQSGPEIADMVEAAGRAMAAGSVERLDAEAVVVTSLWPSNYYHYLTEALPRLVWYREHLEARDGVVVTPLDQSFQRQFMELLGVPAQRLVPVDETCRRFPRVHYLQPFQESMAVRPEAVVPVRDRVRAALGLGDGPAPGRRLYVSREGATRCVVNEDELVAALAPLGFERIVCGRLTVAEQVRTFAEAAIVVGAHGANLANILFMRGGTVVELMPQSYIEIPYWALANAVGVRYAMVITPDDRNSDARKSNLRVQVEELRRFLEAL